MNEWTASAVALNIGNADGMYILMLGCTCNESNNAHSLLICAAVAAVYYLLEIARNRCDVTSAPAGCSAGRRRRAPVYSTALLSITTLSI